MKIYKFALIALPAIVSIACQAANQPLSPTGTMKALNEAAKKNDVETIKKLVSKGTLEQLEQSAKKNETTVDELLKNDEGAAFQELPETRSEKISGDAATIEIKSTATNDWITMPFVKENGVWKIAYERFNEDQLKKTAEEMQEIFGETPKTVSNSAVGK